MELYIRFVFTLAVGLVGAGMVLKTLLDSLLEPWDLGGDLRRGWRWLNSTRRHVERIRAEDIIMELERREGIVPRLSQAQVDTLEQRREALRAMREAEERRMPLPVIEI